MSSRVCIVTGSRGSLGSEIARRLLADGWSVVGIDLEADETNGQLQTVVGDVSNPATHTAAVDLSRSMGRLEGWVNCAGYNILGTVADLSEPDLRRGVEVNLIGTFHGTAAACRAFLASDPTPIAGSIVNLSSIQAAVGFPGFAAYAMTKGGIEALTRQVAAEYVTRGIRCNAVAPGLIESGMNVALLENSPESGGRLNAWRHITPMGRWGTPGDVASAVLFLLGHESSYITGEVLAVNGGALTLAPGQLGI